MALIRKLDQFKIFENVQQTKNYIEKNELRISNEVAYEILDELKKILHKSPNLIFNFFKYFINEEIPIHGDNPDEVTFDHIEGFVNWMKENVGTIKHLPKPIIQYETYEELIDDITKVTTDIKSKEFWNILKYLGYDKGDSDYIDRNYERINNLSKEFGMLERGRKEDFTKKIKHYKINRVSIENFLIGAEEFINKGTSREDIERSIKKFGDKIQIIWDKDDVLMIRTEDKKAIKELGSERWCIVYSEDYYQRYCGFGQLTTQYIVFNFNLPSTDPKSKFGITIDIDDIPRVGGKQDKDNRPYSISEISELTGLPVELFKSLKTEKKEMIEKFKNKFDEINNIEDLFNFLNSISDDEVKTVLSKGLSYGNLVKNILHNATYKLEKAIETIKYLIDNKVPVAVFNSILEIIFNNYNSEYLIEQFKKEYTGKDLVKTFYSNVFKIHFWFF
jgi:hypothetical protein